MSIKQRIRRALARLGYYRPVVGDVVLDRYDRREVTVEAVDDRRVHVAFFVGDRVRRGSLLRKNVGFVR